MTPRTIIIATLFGATATVADLKAQEHGEILDVVQTLFDAMEDRDTAAFASVTMSQMRTLAVIDGDSTALRWGDRDEFAVALSGDGPAFLERMYEPEVMVSGPIATVWAPYDFHLDGEFSHCGVDSFQLVDTGDGWKIVEIMYTVVRDGEYCSEFLSRGAAQP